MPIQNWKFWTNLTYDIISCLFRYRPHFDQQLNESATQNLKGYYFVLTQQSCICPLLACCIPRQWYLNLLCQSPSYTLSFMCVVSKRTTTLVRVSEEGFYLLFSYIGSPYLPLSCRATNYRNIPRSIYFLYNFNCPVLEYTCSCNIACYVLTVNSYT